MTTEPASDARSRLIVAGIVLLALVLRLYHLGAPPIGIHAWRQSDTASIARNYAREGYDFAHPRIDWAGDRSGYAETEFPLYQFSVACVYAATGIHEWAARLLTAVMSAATVWVIFDLATLLASRRVGVWAALLFALLPLCIYYGRTIQPDSMMLLCSAAGINLMLRWSMTGRAALLAASCACITLACLLKLPTLYLGLPVAWLAWRRLGWRMLLSPALWAYGAVVLVAVAAWYWHAYRLGSANGASFAILNSDKIGHWDMLLDWRYHNTIVFRRLAERHFTWAGFPLLLVGLALPRRGAERLLDVWMIAVAVFFLIAPFPNEAHEYYQLPFMLPGVIHAARALDFAWSRWRPLTIGVVVGIAAMSAFRVLEYGAMERVETSEEIAAARAVARITQPGDLVIAVDGRFPGNPTLLYLADRRGWAKPPSALESDALADLKRRGAVAVFGAASRLRSESDRAWLGAIQRTETPPSAGGYVVDLRDASPP